MIKYWYMEHETQEEKGVQVEQKSQLHQVTPLSRYLALGLFIVLPFLGGWIGYSYAPEKVVEVEVEKNSYEASSRPSYIVKDMNSEIDLYKLKCVPKSDTTRVFIEPNIGEQDTSVKFQSLKKANFSGGFKDEIDDFAIADIVDGRGLLFEDVYLSADEWECLNPDGSVISANLKDGF